VHDLPKVGDLVPAAILDGEETDGTPAGLPPGYRLRGVGCHPMHDLYDSAELTEFCRESDTAWAAVVIATP